MLRYMDDDQPVLKEIAYEDPGFAELEFRDFERDIYERARLTPIKVDAFKMYSGLSPYGREFTIREIAQIMEISTRQVRNYIQEVKDKLITAVFYDGAGGQSFYG